MTDRVPLYVRSVAVEKLYGIDLHGLRCEELSPAITVIYGPNAQGKTTLGRAIHGLIWPETLRGLRPSVRGTFSLGEDLYFVDIDGAGARYQRNGLEVTPPAFPEAAHRNRYWLPLHKLIQADDREFAEIIRRVALGGIDIDAAAEALGFQAPSTRPRASTRAVEQAHARMRELEEQQRAVQEDERGLETLRHELRAANQAAEEVSLLERAIAHAEAAREERAARELLEQMPEAVANAREEDAATLRSLRDDLTEARDRKAVAERRLAQLRARHQANIVVLCGSPPSPVAKLDEQHSVLANLETGLTENRRAAAAARAVERESWARIDGGLDPERAAKVDTAGIGSVDAFLEQAEAVRAEEKSFEALKRILGDDEAERLERDLRIREDAITALRAWLRSRLEAGRRLRATRLIVAIAGAAFVLAAAVAIYLGLGAVAGVAAAAALVLAVLWVLLPRPAAAGAPPAEQLERRGLAPPARWTEAAVHERLDQLEDESTELRLRLRSAQHRLALQPRLEALEARRRELEQRRSALARRLGLEPPPTGMQVRYFLEMLTTWQKARAERMAAEEHLAVGERLAEDIRADINATIAPFGADAIGTAAEARAVIDEIAEAYRELAELEREIERETHNLELATSAETTAQQRIDALFARLKLDPEVGDEMVIRLSEQLASFRERHEDYIGKQQRLSDARRHLEAHALFEPGLLCADAERLRERRDAALNVAAGRERLIQQIASVETRIAELRRQHNLEAAMADYAAALDGLEREFDQAADAAIGHRLANHLIDHARDEQLPAVFIRARDFFHRISHGAYRLELDSRQGQFYAFDTVRERGFQLEELSSGTRVQLLLAVRIAFVEEQELGARLPVVLDEALAISDDERAQAIVDAILTLARDGRQIFYFTAQHDEVAKWKRALGGIEHRLIPLGTARDPDELDASALPGAAFAAAIPAPDGADHETYGARLNVPRWHARMRVGQLHLWYLVDDPDELYELLRRGFQHWGQLAALGRDGALDAAGLDARRFARLAVRAAALETWQKGWQIGRGARLDRDALGACPAISATFLDRVAELCDHLGGDGAALLEQLRAGAVPGFRTNKMDELEQYLLDGGYIDPQPHLSDDELRSRVLAQIEQDLEQCGLSLDDIDRFFLAVRHGAPRRAEVEAG